MYRLDDRKNPIWIDAVEAPYTLNGSTLYVEGDNLYVIGQESQSGPISNILLRFDISAGRPVLQSRQMFDGSPSAYRRQGLGFLVSWNPNGQGPISLQVQDYPNGWSRSLPLDYDPVEADYDVTAVKGTSSWAAVMFYYPFTEGVNYETVVFDITGAKAEPIALLPSGGFNHSVAVLQDVLVVGGDVYQVSGNNVTPVSELPTHHVLDSDPVNKRLVMEPDFGWQKDGYRVVDLSDPASPKTSATVVHSRWSTSGVLGPDYFVLLNGPQSVSVYPIEWRPGIRMIDQFPASPWMNDLRVRDGYLYWTGPGWGYKGRSESQGIFEVDDVSSSTSSVVATMDRPGDQVGWAIELNGHYAYVGTDTELIVYDISSPTAPVQGTVLPAPAVSLALLGNYLYAGSNSGKNTLLLVYDVSDPGSPRLVNSLSLPEFAYGIAAQPGWLALAMGKKGLAVYSLLNPAAPAFLRQLGGTCWGVAANRNLLYAAMDVTGLFILDLSNPNNVALLSVTTLAAGDETDTVYYPAALAVSVESRGIAWLCTPKNGRVYGLDVREPKRPRHIAEVVTQGWGSPYAANTFVWNGRLFVAGNDAAFDVTTPQNVGLYEVAQPAPGQVIPDRYYDLPPVTRQENEPSESLKARFLNGREETDDSLSADRQHRRAFRANRPVGDSSKRKIYR